MKRIGWMLCWGLIFWVLPHTTFAAEADPQNSWWPSKVKVGGELRGRMESQINYDFDTTKPDNDTFFLLRTRVYLDLNPTENLQFFFMFQDSETFDQTTALIATPDRHKFYQGYVRFKTKGSLTVQAKLGRQELNYGDQRLIGSFNWSNLGRSFDGAVVRLENKAFWLDGFVTRIHPAQNLEDEFAGLYGHWKNFPGGELEPYLLFLHGDHAGLNNSDLNLVTLGSRISAKFKKNYDYGMEAAYQTGASAGNLVNAFAAHAHFGYTFPDFGKLRLGGEYNFASGDSNPKAGHVTTFNNLFPTNHDKYGYMDLFAWRNMHDFRAGLSAASLKFLKASLDYHLFLLPDPVNGVFRASGAQLRAGTPTASRFAGQEIDLLLKFEPIKYFDAWVGYSIFFPGSFFKDTGGADTAHFFYTQLTARY